MFHIDDALRICETGFIVVSLEAILDTNILELVLNTRIEVALICQAIYALVFRSIFCQETVAS